MAGRTGGFELHTAARYGDLEEMMRLIDKGMSVNSGQPSGTPLHWAAYFGKKEACELLLLLGANVMIRNWFGSLAVDCASGKALVELLREATDKARIALAETNAG